MRSVRSIARIGTVFTAIALVPQIHGQVRTSLEAFAGYYRPFGHFDPASVFSTSLPADPSNLEGTAVGGSVQLSIGRRYGLATQFAVANSRIGQVVTPDGPRGPTDANVSLGMLLAQYDVSPKPGGFRVWLNAGVAAIRHGGDAYRLYGSPVSYGPAIGTSLSVPLAAHLAFAADVTGIFYQFNVPMPSGLAGNPGALEHGGQQDALIHVGLAWRPF